MLIFYSNLYKKKNKIKVYVVVEAAHLMGESFSTPLPCAYKRPVTFMEGFNVHF